MVGLADDNGRTYESKYGTYDKVRGFVFRSTATSMSCASLADKLFHEDCWQLKPEPKKMTKEDIEKLLGYEVEIVTGDDLRSRQDEHSVALKGLFEGLGLL